MHALFFVLFLACTGLFWATLAITRHVQRVRRGKRTMHPPKPRPFTAPSAPAPAHTVAAHPSRLIHSKELQISL